MNGRSGERRARGARAPAPPGPARAGRRRRAARSCSARARCGSRRRSAGTGRGSSSVAAWATRARSWASWTEAEASSANPVWRAAMTSAWSQKIESPWAASERAATWNTAGVSSPAILYMLGSIRIRPCEAVKVVVSAPPWSAPCSAPAAPPSLCISTTIGTVPNRLRPALARPLVGELGHRRGGRDRVDAADLVQPVGDRGGGLVAVDGDAHQPGSGDQLDGVHRALVEAGARSRCSGRSRSGSAGPAPSLITASSGQAPRQPSHSKQFPHERQRPASNAAWARVEAPDDLVEAAAPARRARARAAAGGRVGEVPQVAARRSRDLRVLRRPRRHGAAQVGVDVARGLVAVARRHRHAAHGRNRVAAGEHAGQPGHQRRRHLDGAVARALDAGTRAQEAGVGVLAERQDHRVGLQRLEPAGRPAGARRRRSPSPRPSAPRPSNAAIVRSQFMRTPSRSASSASSAWAGICAARAPVDEQRLVGAEPPRDAGRVHGRVPAAVDGDPPAELRAARPRPRCAGTAPHRRSARRPWRGSRRAWPGARRRRRRRRRTGPRAARRRGPSTRWSQLMRTPSASMRAISASSTSRGRR